MKITFWFEILKILLKFLLWGFDKKIKKNWFCWKNLKFWSMGFPWQTRKYIRGSTITKRLKSTALWSLESRWSACCVQWRSFVHSTILSLENSRSQLQLVTMRQRHSQNEAEEAMAPPKKLVKIFRWCFISISTVRKQTEGTVGLM